MDPKQERALRDGTATEFDEPRETDRESVRDQEERPAIEQRSRKRRRTAAVAGTTVNLESGTPVDQLAREMGAGPVPEMGRAPDNKKNGEDRDDEAAGERAETEVSPRPTSPPADVVPVGRGEARRTLKARREHSKGDGNFPKPEPGPQLLDERPEDRTPEDLPKARDDRTAPKGNITAGQEDRNPDLDVRTEREPRRPARPTGIATAQPAVSSPRVPARPMREATTAASTAGRQKAAPGRPERAEKPKVQTTARRAPAKAVARRGAVAKRAGATKRTTAAKRTSATKRMGAKTRTAAKKRTGVAKRAGATKRAARPTRRRTRKR